MNKEKSETTRKNELIDQHANEVKSSIMYIDGNRPESIYNFTRRLCRLKSTDHHEDRRNFEMTLEYGGCEKGRKDLEVKHHEGEEAFIYAGKLIPFPKEHTRDLSKLLCTIENYQTSLRS